MSNLHFQTYSDKHHQNLSGLCLADLNNATVANSSITNTSITNSSITNTSIVTTTTVKSSRWFSLLVLLVLSIGFLSGCGQKGDLYLVKDAPSNTKFILYEDDKVEDSKTTAKQAAEQQKIEEAAAAQPQDY